MYRVRVLGVGNGSWWTGRYSVESAFLNFTGFLKKIAQDANPTIWDDPYVKLTLYVEYKGIVESERDITKGVTSIRQETRPSGNV